MEQELLNLSTGERIIIRAFTRHNINNIIECWGEVDEYGVNDFCFVLSTWSARNSDENGFIELYKHAASKCITVLFVGKLLNECQDRVFHCVCLLILRNKQPCSDTCFAHKLMHMTVPLLSIHLTDEGNPNRNCIATRRSDKHGTS